MSCKYLINGVPVTLGSSHGWVAGGAGKSSSQTAASRAYSPLALVQSFYVFTVHVYQFTYRASAACANTVVTSRRASARKDTSCALERPATSRRKSIALNSRNEEATMRRAGMARAGAVSPLQGRCCSSASRAWRCGVGGGALSAA